MFLELKCAYVNESAVMFPATNAVVLIMPSGSQDEYADDLEKTFKQSWVD